MPVASLVFRSAAASRSNVGCWCQRWSFCRWNINVVLETHRSHANPPSLVRCHVTAAPPTHSRLTSRDVRRHNWHCDVIGSVRLGRLNDGRQWLESSSTSSWRRQSVVRFMPARLHRNVVLPVHSCTDQKIITQTSIGAFYPDFSTGSLPIGVKFYTAVRRHFGHVFSHFGEGDSPKDDRVLSVNRSIWRALVVFNCYLTII